MKNATLKPDCSELSEHLIYRIYDFGLKDRQHLSDFRICVKLH